MDQSLPGGDVSRQRILSKGNYRYQQVILSVGNYHYTRCPAGATTTKVGETDYISHLEVEKHNHLSSIEDNRVVDVVQKHKKAAVLDKSMALRKMVANIRSELAARGGGVMPASQKSLASNIQKQQASLGGLPKPPKVFSDILDTYPAKHG